jgi:hypothetical protein
MGRGVVQTCEMITPNGGEPEREHVGADVNQVVETGMLEDGGEG